MSDPRAEPSVGSRLAALAATFLGGPLAGLGLANALVPESVVASILSFFAPAVAMMAGLYAWLGTALLILIARGFRWFARRERERPILEPAAAPPGAWVFVPICGGVITLVGIVCGLLPASRGFAAVAGTYTGFAFAYGIALWRLARGGYLPFPEG